MKPANKNPVTRRDFLQLGVSLTAGLALPPLLSSCGGGGGDEGGGSTGPIQTFVQPQVLQSANGLLDISLSVSYLDTNIGTANPAVTQNVSLRAYGVLGGQPVITGPTLIVNTGDTLRIQLNNSLPPNPPIKPLNPSYLGYPNNTNMHTHGLHVYPGIINPSLYGDYVVDGLGQGVAPGESRQYQYQIPSNHPAGPFWYHPHLHGATAIQVASFMSGALMVRGPIDSEPEMATATELIFMFQAPYYSGNGNKNYGVATGKLESFSQVADNPSAGSPVLINGVRRPRIVMQSGEVQRWRFINTQIFNPLSLSLDNHTLRRYTVDGYPRALYENFPAGTGIKLDAGARSSVIIQAGLPGTYYLRTLTVNASAQGIVPEDILAEIVVVAPTNPMRIPSEPLPVTAFLLPITDAELAAKGGLKRNIVFRAISNALLNNTLSPAAAKLSPITQAPASGLLSPGSEIRDWVYNTDLTSVMNTVFSIGSAASSASTIPDIPTGTTNPSQYYPFQSASSITQTVPLDSVEEWTVYNMNSVGHPFHIHVNPMYVIKINGQPITPFWCDTLALPVGGTPSNPTSITFRSRFRDFTGPYVMHCHMLAHEDLGMMQGVTVT
jgi:FtsP/CotA-like multicopper oxidase with cupredoxin domain